MDRRDFLSSSAAVFAAAQVGNQAQAQQGAAPAPRNTAAANSTTAPVFQKFDNTTFRTTLDSIVQFRADAPAAETPEILQPIDTGADTALNAASAEPLVYSPLEVEYLLDALEVQLGRCLELRERAQELQKLAVSARLDLLLDKALTSCLDQLSQLEKNHGGSVAGTLFKPKISNDALVSTDDAQYREQKRNIEKISLDAHVKAAASREYFISENGSGGNHVERFNFVRQLFEVELLDAFRKARSVSRGAKLIYDLDEPLPAPSAIGYLSSLILWYKKLGNAVERQLVRRATTTVCIGLRKGSADAVPYLIQQDVDFINFRTTGTFQFKIAEDFLASSFGFSRVRLRGLDAFAWVDAPTKPMDYFRMRVQLPDQSIRVNPAAVPIWTHKPEIKLPMVSYPSGFDLRVENRREVHNANPVGSWTLSIDKRSLADRETNKDEVLKNIFLVLRLSHDWSA